MAKDVRVLLRHESGEAVSYLDESRVIWPDAKRELVLRVIYVSIFVHRLNRRDMMTPQWAGHVKHRAGRKDDATADQNRALFAVSDAIASHRDLQGLCHELVGRLARMVSFDALSVVLHDPATNLMRLHVIEVAEPLTTPFTMVLGAEDDPAGLVWQTERVRYSTLRERQVWRRFTSRALSLSRAIYW